MIRTPHHFLYAECVQLIESLCYAGARRQVKAALEVHAAPNLLAVPWRERRLLLRNLRAIVPSGNAMEFIARGYRRISNRHMMVARIDRPDYLQFMAAQMRKAPADFMLPEGRQATGGWDDHYRRCYSKDVLHLHSEELFKSIPGSGHDQTGYLP